MSTSTYHSKSWNFQKTNQQPENPFAHLIPNQTYAIIPSFTLESGVTLLNVQLAFTTKGVLCIDGNNAIVVCHALTGSADFSDWWGPLVGGSGRVLDISKFFIICMNSLGSPYGSTSPVTCKDGNPDSQLYGPDFPLTTIRDDVNLQRLLLDNLGVKQVAAVIGGSMGGMLVLEWAYFGKDYVRCIVPIATSSCLSAWGIAWGEAQRQSIFADPNYKNGYYSFSDPPSSGLGAARMSALLTYRTPSSFDVRFGRKMIEITKKETKSEKSALPSSEAHFAIHKEGNQTVGSFQEASESNIDSEKQVVSVPERNDPRLRNTASIPSNSCQLNEVKESSPRYFSAQSYIRYQGSKFAKRFDANCYISITHKMDTHDVSRNRSPSIPDALSLIEQPTLVIGIESDGLFPFSEQIELASKIPHARLAKVISVEGHDAFLLHIDEINQHILTFLKDTISDFFRSSTEQVI